MERKIDIGSIMSEIFSNSYVKSLCMLKPNLTYFERDVIEKNFSRAVGYGILFKSSDGVEQYMALKKQEEQVEYLKRKIAKILGISEQSISKNEQAIREYIIKNFKENGYVFHAGNSYTIQKELKNGLNGQGTTDEYKDELTEIDGIFTKYSKYRPFGWGILDIIYQKTRLVL